MPAAPSDMAMLERRLTSALKQFGERIAPLEAAAGEQRARHEVIVGKLDGLSSQVDKIGDRAEVVAVRCDGLDKRLTVVEVAWQEQMKPGLERLRNLELKVAGAVIVSSALVTGISELVRALAH